MKHPKLIRITFKTKTGVYLSDAISSKLTKAEIETDSYVIKSCFRNKAETFKKEMIINPVTKMPVVLKVDFVKELGIAII